MSDFREKAKELCEKHFIDNLHISAIAQALTDAVEAEREACAKVADEENNQGFYKYKTNREIAQTIRERGNHEL